MLMKLTLGDQRYANTLSHSKRDDFMFLNHFWSEFHFLGSKNWLKPKPQVAQKNSYITIKS